ncbi:MAG: MBOAT family protein [Candidatus Cloacimonetes bacterium]|jgi:alginate O-acetyltransferase complex protein AlgI|nr:MBOAT family protein [Candidatus Cloacimonadota bacterium]
MIISINFFGILFFAVLVYWLIPIQRYRVLFLSFISLFFVGIYDINATILIISLSIFSYSISSLIQANKNNYFFHKLGIIGLIAILVIFKYLGLLTETINHLSEFVSFFPQIRIKHILLPLGISYIIFKHVSYITDVYWKVIKKGDFLDFLCYSSLFTIFVAGPIERFESFSPQILKLQRFENSNLAFFFRRLIYGLFKKLVIANWIGYFISPYLQNYNTENILVKMLVLCGFSMQIYTDFSGYSDIAIGSSRLFGLRIKENFNWPYIQSNISEFWRHWHISLYKWFRDYLYIPLGGSRKGSKRTMLNVIIVFMLCGLWHGASWNFLFWGLWHGVGISIYQVWQNLKKNNDKLQKITCGSVYKCFSTLITFLFVTIGWWWWIK